MSKRRATGAVEVATGAGAVVATVAGVVATAAGGAATEAAGVTVIEVIVVTEDATVIGVTRVSHASRQERRYTLC